MSWAIWLASTEEELLSRVISTRMKVVPLWQLPTGPLETSGALLNNNNALPLPPLIAWFIMSAVTNDGVSYRVKYILLTL